MFLWLWNKVRSLNFFNSKSSDPSVKRREQHTTRVYILLLIVASIVLFCYSVFNQKTVIYTVDQPTEATYINLLAKYGDKVQCPCSRLALPYEAFITIEASYHQICSSEFISDSFIAQMFALRDTNTYRGDFMQISGSYFAGLNILCKVSQEVFTISLINFQATLFVNAKLLGPAAFKDQTAGLMQWFIDLTAGVFASTIQELIEFSTGNQILSVSSISYNLRIVSNGSVRIEPASLSGCSCLLHPLVCSEEAGFYSYDSSIDSFTLVSTLMGIRTTCFAFLSLMVSNLGCWYSSDCYANVRSKSVLLFSKPHFIS